MRYFTALALFALSLSASETVRLEVKGRLTSGSHPAVFNVYASPDAVAPVASETRTITIDANGNATTQWGSFAAGEERWIAVNVDGKESKRIHIDATRPLTIAVNIVSSAAISANGMIESVSQGFKFPDGSIQTSAAQVSGGVPSVNGIGSAVTINAGGTASVSTVGSTITVSAPSFGTPVAIGTSNAAGASTSVARADHVHDHGNLAGGTLHAAATSGAAGFMSAADKSKLDSLVPYARTIVVSPGANPTASGTSLLNALAGINTNSSTNPYLIKIEPGVYNLGGNGLQMKSYVDIEGSGQNATFLTAARGGASLNSAVAAVVGAPNSEIRSLTITNSTTSGFHVAGYLGGSAGSMNVTDATINAIGPVYVYGVANTTAGATVAFSRVTILSDGPNGGSGIVDYGAYAAGATINLSDCTVTATGNPAGPSNIAAYATSSGVLNIRNSSLSADNFGIVLDSGSLIMMSSTITSYVGLWTHTAPASNAQVMSSRITGDGASVRRTADTTLRIAYSQINGPVDGTPTCIGLFDQNFAPVTCP